MGVLVRCWYAAVPGQALTTGYYQHDQGTIESQNGPNLEVLKEILHVIKHVLDIKNLDLKIEATGNANEPERMSVVVIVTMLETQ